MKSRILLLTLLSLSGTCMAGEPIRLHPQNPHYFVWRDKPTVLIGSGEHYGAVINLDFDYLKYLETLKSDGLNQIRVFSGTFREVPGSFGIVDNTLAPAPGRYVCPWARSDLPGYAQGGNKFDLSQWDETYFTRLKAFMGAARDRGIVVEFVLFTPLYIVPMWEVSPTNATNNINGIGAVAKDDCLSLKHATLVAAQEAVTRKFLEIIARRIIHVLNYASSSPRMVPVLLENFAVSRPRRCRMEMQRLPSDFRRHRWDFRQKHLGQKNSDLHFPVPNLPVEICRGNQAGRRCVSQASSSPRMVPVLLENFAVSRPRRCSMET